MTPSWRPPRSCASIGCHCWGISALTGPAVRGDAGTIGRNLEALRREAPDAVAPYVALARTAAELATEAGRLSEEGLARVEEALKRWS